MGMYTAIATSITLKDSTPKDVVETLKLMVEGDWEKLKVMEKPNHHLFQCDRWDCLFTMDSAYFDFDTKAIFDGKTLFSISNLKNYRSDKTDHTPIESFFDWIWPHCDVSENEIIGASQYEEDYSCGEEAKVYLIKNNKLLVKRSDVDFEEGSKIITKMKALKLLEGKL